MKIHHKSFSNHELNNEGCLCELCQKINLKSQLQIKIEPYIDCESEYFNRETNQVFIQIATQAHLWDKWQRKLRFLLPDICVYDKCNPEYLISKNKDSIGVKIIKNKSKMNMFEIQNYFLESFIFHNPSIINKKREKECFSQYSKTEPIAIAKYKSNMSSLLTLSQIQSLFKSKHKHLRDGMMYIQTLIGGKNFNEIRVKIDINEVMKNQKEIFEKAKLQISIIVNQIKVTDAQFYTQKTQIQYEKELKNENIKKYLLYLSLKMILLSSKISRMMIVESVFKYVVIKGNEYLWDIHSKKQQNSASYWNSGLVEALEYKLKKTMSMMDMQPQPEKSITGRKGKQIKEWLDRSTSFEWDQMRVIKTRLERLETEKRSLMESQRQSLEASTALLVTKSFKVRSIYAQRRKQFPLELN